jgi:hypothetical protein
VAEVFGWGCGAGLALSKVLGACADCGDFADFSAGFTRTVGLSELAFGAFAGDEAGDGWAHPTLG